MFECSEEAIALGQFLDGQFCRVVAGRQGPQSCKCVAVSQRGIPATPDQLLGLGKKFDLSNATPAGFDVVAFNGNAGAKERGKVIGDRVRLCTPGIEGLELQ